MATPPPQSSQVRGVGVQVGAFQRPEGAAGLTRELAEKGYPTRTIPSASLHRVVIGPLPDQSAAEAVLAQLKQLGYDGYVRNDVAFGAGTGNVEVGMYTPQSADPVSFDSPGRLRLAPGAPQEPAALETPVSSPARSPVTQAAPTSPLRPATDAAPEAAAVTEPQATDQRATEPLPDPPSNNDERAAKPETEPSLAADVSPPGPRQNDQDVGRPPTAAEVSTASQSRLSQQPEPETPASPEAITADLTEQAGTPAIDAPAVHSTPAPQGGQTIEADARATAEADVSLENPTEVAAAGEATVASGPAAKPIDYLLRDVTTQTTAGEAAAATPEPAAESLAQAAETAAASQESPAEQREQPAAPALPGAPSEPPATEGEPAAAADTGDKPKLAIKVLEGDEVVNTVGRRSARDPVVQVVDENDRPVGGAVVVFDLPARGASGTFANGARSVTILTGPDGTASATGFTANSAQGQYAMQVTASHQGQTASTVVAQTNAAATGGLSAAATAGIVAGIAGGAAVALVVVKNSIENRIRQEVATRTPPSVITTVSPGPSAVGAP